MKRVEFKTSNENETRFLASAVARVIPKGQIIALNGDLAAGKSVFSSAVLKELGYNNKFTSPTYTIINEYEASFGTSYHMDAYRLSGSDDLDVIGYYDIVDDCLVMLIEWAEIIEDVIDEDALFVNITKGEDDERYFEMYSGKDELIDKLTEALDAYSVH